MAQQTTIENIPCTRAGCEGGIATFSSREGVATGTCFRCSGTGMQAAPSRGRVWIHAGSGEAHQEVHTSWGGAQLLRFRWEVTTSGGMETATPVATLRREDGSCWEVTPADLPAEAQASAWLKVWRRGQGSHALPFASRVRPAPEPVVEAPAPVPAAPKAKRAKRARKVKEPLL